MIRQLVLLITCLFFSIDCFKYCQKQYNCGNKIHTMCKRKSCGPSSACGKNFVNLGMNTQTRELVLELHNNIRNDIALGITKIGGNSHQAADMNELVYDNEMEKAAQCWANYCMNGSSQLKHDQCRKTKQFSYVGQNIYKMWGHLNFNDTRFIEKSIRSWYDEIEHMDKSIIDKFHNIKVGHFTQMIWAETTHIGCGRNIYGNGEEFNFLFVCNYGTGGNAVDDPVYTRGKPCSQCTRGCSKRYKGLCAPNASNSLSVVIKSMWINLLVLIVITINYLNAYLKHIPITL